MNYLPQANLLTIESQNASTVPHTVTLPDYMTLEYSTSTACERPLARVCPDNGQYTVQDDLTMQQQTWRHARVGRATITCKRARPCAKLHL